MATDRRTTSPRRSPARSAALALLVVCCAPLVGCGPFGADEAQAPQPPLSTAAPGAGSVAVLGSGVPQPTPTTPVVVATPVPLDTAAPTPLPRTTTPTPETTTQDPSCTEFGNRRVVAPGVAQVGPGTVELAWHSRKSESLQGWRVAAVPQALVGGEQPPLVWTDAAAPEGCQRVTATFTGLAAGTYHFWLHARLTSAYSPGETLEMTGTSLPVVVP